MYTRSRNTKIANSDLSALLRMAPFCLPIAFHFRSENPSSTSVLIQTAIFLAGVVAGAPSLLKARSWTPGERLLLLWVWFFIGGTVLVSIFRAHPLIEIFRNSAPLVNFALAISVVLDMRAQRYNPTSVWRSIILLSTISAISKITLIVAFSNIPINEIRYQIISGAAPILCGVFVSSLLDGHFRRNAIPSMINIIALILAVTRTYIIIFAAQILAMMIFRYKSVLSRRSITTAVAATASALAVIAVAAYLPGNPIGRWTERVFLSERAIGYDLTSLTRKAENNYQIRKISSSADSIIFGQGIGTRSYFDADTARPYYATLKIRHDEFHSEGFGHNNYISIIYIGGIVFGLPFLIALVIPLLDCGSLLSRIKEGELSAIPVSYIAYIVFGLLAGTFGDRQVALFFGLCTGSLLWLKTCTNRHDA